MAEDRIILKRVVLIGGSAGSLEIILNIVAMIPATSSFIYIIVVHRKYSSDSVLEDLLSSKTKLRVKEIEDKESIVPGTIYIAPADYHLLIENEYTFSLDASEKIYFSRPSIDVSFESASDIFKDALIAVLLSGANADGAKGMKMVELSGGLVIVQDPATADVSYMPEQALKLLDNPVIVPAQQLPEYLSSMLSNGIT